MNIFLDTSILINVFRGVTSIKEGNNQFFINPIVYSEVVYGLLYIGKDPQLFDIFIDQNNIDILLIGKEAAVIHATKKLELNKLGKSLPDNDLLIAASCFEYGLPIATTNVKHFERIKALKIVKNI